MCHVSILPDIWDIDWSPPLRYDWKQNRRQEALIPWSLASDYFRKPQVSIDCTQTPPVIGPYEAPHDRA